MRAQAEEAVVDAYDAERAAADRLRELDDLKNAFLMAISHELRTPLTSVVGYAALLEDGITDLSPQEASEFASAIGVSARRLDGLLIDLLDMERCSRGVVEPRYRLTDLRELVRRVLEHTSYDGRVTVHVAKETQAVVDPALLERIVENLVMNAIKHTPPGTAVSIKAERLADALVICVEDEGPGVPDDLKDAIFEPFRHGGVPEHTPGTGVGLALVAQFAKVHGGQAWVEDRVGGGSSFRVSLPATPKIDRLAS
jgi:signal transduction histidine kinase